MIDVSAVLNAHDESVLAGPSMRSFEEAIAAARASGIRVESVIVLDRPDEATTAQFADAESRGHRIIMSTAGDPGLARNAAVQDARGNFVAFLDADDLWSVNWLTDAFGSFEHSSRLVAHPELSVFFGLQESFGFNSDSEKPNFDPGVLRVVNYWSALVFTRRQILLEFPYAATDFSEGFGYEDWHWNCVTIAAGVSHRPVRGTAHFVRRKVGRSQLTECDANDVLPRSSPLTSYKWRSKA